MRAKAGKQRQKIQRTQDETIKIQDVFTTVPESLLPPQLILPQLSNYRVRSGEVVPWLHPSLVDQILRSFCMTSMYTDFVFKSEDI